MKDSFTTIDELVEYYRKEIKDGKTPMVGVKKVTDRVVCTYMATYQLVPLLKTLKSINNVPSKFDLVIIQELISELEFIEINKVKLPMDTIEIMKCMIESIITIYKDRDRNCNEYI